MRFRGLDLNLLAVLSTLLQLRSVSAAARQMNLSQPAMSAALARLRDYFGDPLLLSHGKRMYPTAFAESLLPQVQSCLGQIETMLATNAGFDPLSSQRSFRIIASDYIIAALIAPLTVRFAQDAPGVRLHLALPDATAGQQIADGYADLFIGPRDFLTGGHPSELLLEEEHVVVGWSGNPIFDRPLDEVAFLRADHVSVGIGARGQAAFADLQLALLGKTRQIVVEAPSFATVPWLLIDTDRIAVMHARLAQRVARVFPMRTAPIPFAFPVMQEHMQFHQTRAQDGGLAWLRSALQEAGSSMEWMDHHSNNQLL